VLLTELSTAHHTGQLETFKKQAVAGLSLLVAVALPATAVLIALAVPLTRLLYERGQFTAHDVVMTSQALSVYAVGILAYGTSQVMVRLFNAMKDARTPAVVGLASMGLTAVACWLLMQYWGHWGIALATSLVSYVNTFALYAIFRRRHGPLDEAVLGRRLGAHLLLAVTLGGCLLWLGRPLAHAPGSLLTLDRLTYLIGSGLVGSGLYLTLGWLCGVKEIRMLGQLGVHASAGLVSRLVRFRDGRRDC